jgi:hypothetical protein
MSAHLSDAHVPNDEIGSLAAVLHISPPNLEMVHNDGVVVLAVVVPGLISPLLIGLSRVIAVL